MKLRLLLTALTLSTSVELANWSGVIATLLPSSPYLEASTDAQIIPIFSYEGERLSWRGPSLEYRLTGEARQTLRWTASLNLSPNEFDADKSDALNGIDDFDF